MFIFISPNKDQNCKICKRTKITRAPCRRRNGEVVPRAEKFGVLITADHKVLSGAGLSPPMDPDVSVQNKKNFTGNPEKLAKVPGIQEETKSHLH